MQCLIIGNTLNKQTTYVNTLSSSSDQSIFLLSTDANEHFVYIIIHIMHVHGNSDLGFLHSALERFRFKANLLKACNPFCRTGQHSKAINHFQRKSII